MQYEDYSKLKIKFYKAIHETIENPSVRLDYRLSNFDFDRPNIRVAVGMGILLSCGNGNSLPMATLPNID